MGIGGTESIKGLAGASVSRRNLLKGVAMGAAAAGVMGVASSAMASEAASAKGDGSWDGEYDVVVLGLGGTGANAAVAAYEEGAKVLVCEKAPEGQEPCNTKAAGQNVMATDDADGLYTYLSALMGKFHNWDEEALRAYCDGCAENWNWAVDVLGMDPDIACPATEDGIVGRGPCTWNLVEDAWGMDRAGYVPMWNEFPELEGNEHSLNILVGANTFDAAYYNLLMSAVNSRVDDDKLTVWKSCAGKHLILDDEGTVIGAVVEKDGKELRIKANGGVVLATGGFEADADMMASYTQQPYVYLQAGTTNTGDGVRMALEAGADLWHMSNVAGWLWAYQKPGLSTCKTLRGATNGIYAGISGARFMDESASNRHGRIDVGGRWISTPMPLPTYYIVDSTQIGEKMIPIFSEGNAEELENGEIIQGATIAELSENIRAVGDAPDFNINGELDEALERYNAHCHANDGAGEKDDFGRECTVPVETGPFYAVKIGPSMYNTQGGPRRNYLAQVCGIDGMPIEGLFSGGELGSVFADMYNGGGNLGETMVFGRIAGRNAAHRAQGTFESATEPVKTHQQKLDAEAASAEATAGVLTNDYADGTYEGKGQGYAGPITLSVTVEGGKIAKVEVVESSETEAIGAQALPVYCKAVVGVEDLGDIDVASGASNTLRGFTAAVEDALSQAK